MKLNIILYNSECGKQSFQLAQGVRPWGILMIISKGKYTLTFPETGQSCVILPNEVSYIPPNTAFIRQIEEAIDFHQFAFRIEQTHTILQGLRPGKLPIPQVQTAAILRSLAQGQSLPAHSGVTRYSLEHILLENYLFSQDRGASALSADIQQAVSYLKEHLSEKIDMDMLAARVYLSRTGLIWKFRRQLGTTPQQYLITLRMSQAKQLLLEEDVTITQIAERCGYANAYYFSNAFRSSTGMSPTVFRRFHLGITD